jgi:hypothetical protein
MVSIILRPTDGAPLNNGGNGITSIGGTLFVTVSIY